MRAERPMTFLLMAFQGEAPAPPLLTPQAGLLAGLGALIPTLILVWREFTKSKSEREATAITRYEALADRAAKTAEKAQGEIAPLVEQNGKLKDLLTAEQVAHGDVRAELKYTKVELQETKDELQETKDELADVRKELDSLRARSPAGGG